MPVVVIISKDSYPNCRRNRRRQTIKADPRSSPSDWSKLFGEKKIFFELFEPHNKLQQRRRRKTFLSSLQATQHTPSRPIKKLTRWPLLRLSISPCLSYPRDGLARTKSSRLWDLSLPRRREVLSPSDLTFWLMLAE